MIKRILLVRPDKIGDLILTLPMATAIKAILPGAHVSFLVREYTAPLLKLSSDADEIVVFNRDWSFSKIVSVLRETRSDAIFFFTSEFKLTVASFFAGIPLRIGRASWWYSFLYNRKIYEHRKTAEHNEAEYNTRMLNTIGLPVETTPLPEFNLNLLPKNPLNISNFAVLHLRTGGSAPAWDENKFIELAHWITNGFYFPVILTGLPEDNEYLLSIAERMKHSSSDVHIHTQNDLLNLAAVLFNAKLVVSGSTGPGHIAAAFGTPTIGLFPATMPLSKERWGFRGKRVINLSPLIKPKIECPHCKDCICINEITTEQAKQAITDLKIA